MGNKSSAIILWAGVSMAIVAACASGEPDIDDFPPESSPASSTASTSGPGGSGTGLDPMPEQNVVSIEVHPATATIDVSGAGTGVPQSYTATGVLDSGGEITLTDCAWSIDKSSVGVFDNTSFVPHGSVGGLTVVTCESNGVTGSAEVAVVYRELIDDASVGGALPDAIANATPDPFIHALLYPYDGTVFPRGLSASPELMWDAPAAGDAYIATFMLPYAEITATFAGSQPGRYGLPLAAWKALLGSSEGDQVEVTLYRLAGGVGGSAHIGPMQRWTLSTADLKGTVYYWRIRNTTEGGVARMPFGQPPEQFTSQCLGCHAVANDGSVLGAGSGYSAYDTAYNTQPTAERFESSVQTGYRGVSPDGAVIARVPASPSGFQGGAVELVESATDAVIGGSGMDLLGLTSTPAFSPDHSMMALSVRQPPHDQTYHNVFNVSDLAVVQYDPVARTASSLQVIMPAGGEAMVFPTFTPDNKRVLFQRGNRVRGRAVVVPEWQWSHEPSHADLWAVDVTGNNAVALERASNFGVRQVDRHHSYHPVMSPVVQGGYFWVVFSSTRGYGNRLTLTDDNDYATCVLSDFADCRRKQLWIAAIDVNAADGIDPSRPAFWLPGQELDHNNFDGFWALDQCKAQGEVCDVGFECCEGTCIPQGDHGICAEPEPGGCANAGDACETAADCCAELQCIGGVCDLIPE